MYVEPLIGEETVNTMTLETIHAYRDHGQPVSRLQEGTEEARKVFQRLSELEIDIGQVTQQLEDEGVQNSSTLRLFVSDPKNKQAGALAEHSIGRGQFRP
jgi:transaldolase/transaldolase/glucose-6-phosphate isomerase